MVAEDFQTYTLPLWYVLRDHTKAELLDICRAQGIRKVSRLNKDELIGVMTTHLPSIAAEKMLYWDQPTYDLMNYIVTEEDPIYPFDPDEPDGVEAYLLDESIGFAFHVEKGGYWLDTLIVPKGMQHAFLILDDTMYQHRIKRNTKVLRLAKGLLHYYGVLTPTEMAHFLNRLLDEPLDVDEIAAIAAEMGPYNWDIRWDGERFADSRMLSLLFTLNERDSRGDLEYRKLTYKEVWQAGEPGFSESTAESKALADFLLETITEEEATQLLEAFFGLFQSDLQPTELLPGVADFLELESDNEVRKLASLVVDCYNKTPLWVLKGHTPAQLAQHSTDNVYDLASRKKVGRNDPCPCGSGLKFKRCCGKN